LNITLLEDRLYTETKEGKTRSIGPYSTSEDNINYITIIVIDDDVPAILRGCSITFELKDDDVYVAYFNSPDFDEAVKLFKQKK